MIRIEKLSKIFNNTIIITSLDFKLNFNIMLMLMSFNPSKNFIVTFKSKSIKRNRESKHSITNIPI